MLKKNRQQYDLFTLEVFNRLVPKDHLLVKIDNIIDFEFVYEKLNPKYSHTGRGSKDPVMMVKILLLEYLYGYSDVQMEKSIQTDIAIRWFLGLSLDEKGPDASTISYFRVKRMTEEDLEDFFNEVVKIAIENGFVKTQRFIMDSTDVAANVNFPSSKDLLQTALGKVLKRIHIMDSDVAKLLTLSFDNGLEKLKHSSKTDYTVEELALLIKQVVESISGDQLSRYIKDERFIKSYQVLFDLLKQVFEKGGDKIISVVDPDARVARKCKGVVKKGYKNHIIIDEDSEMILASVQTPFNVNDDKRLVDLIEKTENNHNLKPKELSGDKAYGIYENRVYLEERNIRGHFDFIKTGKENKHYGIEDFIIDENLEYVICPAGQKTYNCSYRTKPHAIDGEILFKFDKSKCKKCPLNEKCLPRKKDSKTGGRRELRVDSRYATVLRNKEQNKTSLFETARKRRSIVERRFATLVRNCGLRRSRYLGMVATSKHIILSNTACNIRRLLNLFQQSDSHALIKV